MKKPKSHRNGAGLALAGGGPLGSIYEIGALCALQDCIVGVDFTDFDVYVGVSAGAFVAAGLVNGFAPRELCARFIESEAHKDPFEPDILLKPALHEYARRLSRLPELAASAFAAYIGASVDPYSTPGFFEAFQRLTRALPNGLFDNAPVAAYLARMFDRPGRTDDFRKLRRRLYIVATDLDTAEAVTFGAPGFDHIPISQAVKASSALPGLYPPARIEGRDYVDGALKKTLHASVALKDGAKLLFCINPLVPYDARMAGGRAANHGERLAEDGLASVMSQTFRALIQSRMRVGMERYAHQYPGADLLLFEPARDDALIFFSNVFSYADRRRLAEHAWRHTRSELRRRAAELEPILARHGLALDHAALADPDRRLIGAHVPRQGLAAQTDRLSAALDRLDHALAQGAPAPARATSRRPSGRSHAGQAKTAHARTDT